MTPGSGPGLDGSGRPLRVLLTSDFYVPHIGGAERQVMLLAGALAERGHDVRVATAGQPGLPRHEVLDGIPVDRVPTAATSVPWFSGDAERRFVPPAPDPALSAGLARLRHRWRPDVVHANGWIAYASAVAVGRSRSALVLSVRDYGYACAVRTLLQEDRWPCSGPGPRKCLECAGHHYGTLKGTASVAGVFAGRPLLGSTVRGVHSVSRFVEAMFRRDLGRGGRWDRVRFERIADIVDPPSARPLDARERELAARLPREPFVLFVGALRDHKGLGVLLAAYRAIRDAADGHVPPLVLIGTRWPDTPRDDEMPDGVTVLSDVPHPVVMEAWRRSLFGIVPSVWADPLPGTVREGLVSERAVIGSRVGGIPDMIDDGVNGLLVEPGDVDGLAAAIRRLLEDPELRDRLGTEGRRSVEGLGPDDVARRFEAFYRAAMAVPR